jgi:hypothetical protein
MHGANTSENAQRITLMLIGMRIYAEGYANDMRWYRTKADRMPTKSASVKRMLTNMLNALPICDKKRKYSRI